MEVKAGASRLADTNVGMGRLPTAEPPTFDLHGWKAIGQHLGRAQRTVQRLATRSVNPLPVGKIGGIVAASSAALNRWAEGEMARAREATTDGQRPRLVAV